MSTPTASGPTGGGRLRRRVLLVTFASVATFLLAASVAWACTTYWGEMTIENIDASSPYEYSVVGDPTAGMDRCDGTMDSDEDASDGGSPTVEAWNGQGDSKGSDTVRVEISMWEPGGQDSGNSCNADDHSVEPNDDGVADDDGDGHPEHSLADAGVQEVYVNVWKNTDPDGISTSDDGPAYTDESDTDTDHVVYDDIDDLQIGGKESEFDPSSERDGDCMGDGAESNDGIHDEAGPIDIVSDEGKSNAGEFKNGSDDDSDGVNDVEIEIDSAINANDTGHAGAICVSQGSANHSAPQMPIVIN